MKIKSDFVTNSSSTCFIVLVPNSYVVNDEILKKAIEEEGPYWNEEIPSFEQIKTEVSEYLELLKDGNTIWNDGYDGVSPFIYTVTDRVISNEGFVIASVDIGPSDNMLSGVREEKIMEVLMDRIDVSKICKIKRSEDVKKDS
jgi:hypothetical protein